ncbi:MAG: methylmalonyl-CoA mutase small subunit [Bacteroidales bacterium]|nr:methylmalonyl-CoA mutase small subunit [Bacteroidales bacterium]
MDKLQDKLSFRDDFPPTSTEAWEEKIHEDLKGADYQKKLIWRTIEGFSVRPYYRSEDLKHITHLRVHPGQYPWIRSKKDRDNSWWIWQGIDARDDVRQANQKALGVLNRGVDALTFRLDDSKPLEKKDLDVLLKGICIPAIQLNFESGSRSAEVVEFLKEKLKQDGTDARECKGGVDFKPLDELNRKGRLDEKAFDQTAALVRQSQGFGDFAVIEVDGSTLHNAGASNVQELGYALAMGNEYLARLTDQGLSVDEIAPRIRFKLGIGPAYFLEMAKLRAARMLWSRLVEAYEPDEESSTQMTIHAETSRWNQTVYDPYVNMLRGTTEAMSAALGGTDSLAVTPYDKPFEKPTDFAQRMSRNTQIILKEEAYFDKVVDPAGGAYYIENLTQSIAEHAWRLFQDTENNGGYIATFKNGSVQEKIREVANQRNLNLARRKEALVGVNLYPNAREVMESGYDASTLHTDSQEVSGAIAEPIKPYRGAEEIEQMRLKTERKTGDRPKTFMLTIGDAKMRRARAQFSASFFAAAGFEIIDNIGFDTVEEGVQEALNKKADIVVVCSSDEAYPRVAPQVYQKLKDQAIVVVAGYPKDSIEMLQEKGLKHFIHVKSNLVETLSRFQKELGIE